jgi:hypothetical protein
MTDIKNLVSGLYDLLEPVDPADRKKAIKAALTMLGDDAADADKKGGKGGRAGDDNEDGDDPDGDDNSEFSSKVRTWMSRNKLTAEEIAHVFHVDGETVDVIADTVPGKNQKAQAINAYMLTGIAEFLKTGESKFTDKVARETCKKLGCYGETNHATYLKKPGNVLSGSKESGWTVTGPGMKTAAELIKGFTSE